MPVVWMGHAVLNHVAVTLGQAGQGRIFGCFHTPHKPIPHPKEKGSGGKGLEAKVKK